MSTEAIITLIIGALGGGGIVAFLKYRSENRVNEANADKTAAESWVLLVTQLQERVAILERALIAKDARIDDLEAEVDELRGYMEKNGLNPPPRKPRKETRTAP